MKFRVKLFIIIFASVFVAVSSFIVYTSVKCRMTIGETIKELPENWGLYVLFVISDIQCLFEKDMNPLRGINTSNNYKYKDDFFAYDNNDVSKRIGRYGSNRLIFTTTIHTVNGLEHELLIARGDYVDLYSRVDYEIPQSGTVTAVFSKHNRLTQHQGDIDKFLQIVNSNGEKHHISTEQWSWHSEPFYFAYNGCPVAKQNPGYIVYADEKWLFVTSEIRKDYLSYNEKHMNYLESIGEYDLNEDLKAIRAFHGIGTIITDTEIIEMLKSDRMFWMRPTSAKQMMNNE